MERNNRIVWVFVGVAVVLLCCFVAAIAIAASWFAVLPWQSTVSFGELEERREERFDAGSASTLTVDNFAGSVNVRAGESGEFRVIAVKRAANRQNVDNIQIEFSRRDGGLEIKTRKPATFSNASVRFEITAPAGTRLDLHTGAGSIDVQGFGNNVKADTGAGSITISDVQGYVDANSGAGSVTILNARGEIKAHSGAGSLDVRGASGPVRLDSGAGSIDYQGQPQGACLFETGTGSITLRLPDALNMQVDLETGMGNITVDYQVSGEVSRREVKGTIGNGGEGSIRAHTGTGSIDLIRR